MEETTNQPWLQPKTDLLPLDRGLLEEKKYWLERLAPGHETSGLPLDRPRGAVPAGKRGRLEFAIEGELYRKLVELTGDGTFLMYTSLVAALKVCLFKYAGHPGNGRVAVGSFSRQAAGASQGAAQGPINLLVIVDDLAPEQTFRDLLLAVRQSLMDAYGRQRYPFANLLGDLSIDLGNGNKGRVPLFDVAIGLESLHGPLPEIPTEVTLSLRKEADRLAGRADFAADLLDAATVERFLGHLTEVLRGGLADAGARIADLELLGGEERRRALIEWNDTERDFPRGAVLHQLFEEQAQRTPDALALSGGAPDDTEWSYRELEARSNRLAHHLRALGVGPEDRVGIHLPRSPQMVEALLGVLKAGGVYVPLDPDYPAARLELMLEDARPAVLITLDSLDSRLSASGAVTLRLDADRPVIDSRPGDLPPDSGVTADHPAYVIYTSGSTGRPNGVVVPHRGVVSTILDAGRLYQVAAGDRVLQFVSFSFDASVLETFLALSNGAALCFATREARLSGAALGELMRERRITTAVLVPSTLAGVPLQDLPDLKSVSIGGESATGALVSQWAGRCRLLNCYGPTETTMIVSHHLCAGAYRREPPIGHPIANTRAYVLDRFLRPVPAGVAGDLYFGGVGVTRGYLGRPGLTAERFVPSPFGEEDGGRPGERLYRTDDLARRLPGGAIEFLGRVDQQVKVHGLRIELGEIETALAEHPAVADVVVQALLQADIQGGAQGGEDRQPGDRVLVAWLVPRGKAPNASELRAFLEAKLPAYMVPSFFVPLAAMPLSPTGKIDRAALPAPDASRPEMEEEFVAPASPVQQAIADIWQQLLGIDEIGAEDNFFDLGGRSLNAMMVMSQLSDRFEVDLPLDSFFDNPTLSGLARAVNDAMPKPAAPANGNGASAPAAETVTTSREIPRVPRDRPLALSFAQQRLWFLHQIMPESAYALYNGPVPVRLSGRLDLAALEGAFREILRRHESLRTSFAERDGQPVQVVAPEVPFALPLADLSGLAAAARDPELLRLAEADAGRPFDLGRAPLLRATLVRLAGEEHALLLTIHHIVFDLWSTEVFLNEMGALYAAFAAGRPSPLPELPVQYADYAQWQRGWLTGEVLDRQLDYWRRQLAAMPELDMPFARPRPEHPTFRGAIEGVTFPAGLAEALRALSREEEATMFMTLLGAFASLLYRYRGQEDVVLGTGIANRGRMEVEGLIGFFVNTLVLRVDLSGNPTFREVVRRARKMALDAYAHQDVPFERVVEELQPQRDASHAPLFRAIFGLQNTARDRRIELPGLQIGHLETHSYTSKFDMVFAMLDTEAGLVGDVEYSLDLFEPETIREMLRRFRFLLEAVAADPDIHLIDIPLGDPAGEDAAMRAPALPSAASRFQVEQFEF